MYRGKIDLMTGGLLLLMVPISVALSDRAGEPFVLGSTLEDSEEALLGEKVREDCVALDCDRLRPAAELGAFVSALEAHDVSILGLCRLPSGAIAAWCVLVSVV